jgi:NADH-quinone oxidoreductase subunit L
LADLFFKFDNKWVLDPIVNGVGRLGMLLSDGFYRLVDVPLVDGTVNLVGRAGAALSAAWDWIDLHVVDGFVNFTGRVTEQAGRLLRRLQTGRVQQYGLVAAAGIILLLAVFILR